MIRRAVRFSLTLIVFLFLADFLLQFVHARRNGNSLPERVHRITAPVMAEVEQTTQIDLRYAFRYRTVDFMPMAIFLLILLGKMPLNSLLWQVERRMNRRGPEPPPTPEESAYAPRTTPATPPPAPNGGGPQQPQPASAGMQSGIQEDESSKEAIYAGPLEGAKKITRRLLRVRPKEKKILIAEPDGLSAAFLFKTLAEDFEILESPDGVDVAVKATTENPDLILLTEALPGMTGPETCRRMRRNGIRVPVLLISNRHQRFYDEADSLTYGVDAVLQKPVSARLLKLKIQRLLERGPQPETAAGTAKAKTGPSVNEIRARAGMKGGELGLSEFRRRVRLESQFSTEHDSTFCVAALPEKVMRHGPTPEASGAVLRQLRGFDAVCPLADGLVLLLPDTARRGTMALVERLSLKVKENGLEFERAHIYEFNGASNFWEFISSQLGLDGSGAGLLGGRNRRLPFTAAG